MSLLPSDLQKYYETYLSLKYHKGWWNLEELGTFTPQEFLEKLLRMEAYSAGNQINESTWEETSVRNFYYRVWTYKGEGPAPADPHFLVDVLTYIQRKNLAHGAVDPNTGNTRDALLKITDDPSTSPVWRTEPPCYIPFAAVLINHPAAWENRPWVDPTAPMEFGGA
jgi:hypothetical protein